MNNSTDRKSMPSNYQIALYWSNKKVHNELLFDDLGEPCCWCCKKPMMTENDDLLENGDFKTIWNKTSRKLERCHIIPKSLGGSNNPDNLVLMCNRCHKLAPDTTSAEMFFDWMLQFRKNYLNGINIKEVSELIDNLKQKYEVNMSDFNKWLLEAYSNEKIQEIILNSVGSHSGEINFNSYIIAYMSLYLKQLN